MTDKITTLEQLDAKMAEQRARLQEKKQEKVEPPELIEHTPFTDQMTEVFREEVAKSQKCRVCNWQNYGQFIIILNHIQIMRENLPLPTIVCEGCGSLFIPKWARKVANQAIAQENKIIKQMSPSETEPGAE